MKCVIAFNTPTTSTATATNNYIIIITIILFIQGIYTHIPEINHVSVEYSVAAIL